VTRIVKTGRGVRNCCCLSAVLFDLYSEYVSNEDVEGFVDFRIRRKVIRIVQYTDELVLLAKEETMLKGMIDRLKLEDNKE
jgi:hypothetical protein